jgi:hypothetical protein
MDTLDHFFHRTTDNIIELNHAWFKYLFSQTTHAAIIEHMISVMDSVLSEYPNIDVILDMKSVTLLDIDRYKHFMRDAAIILSHRFPDKLNKCYVKNAPFILSQLVKILGLFLDKKTQRKIVLEPRSATSSLHSENTCLDF